MSLQARFKKPEPASVFTGDGPRFYTLKGAAKYLGLPEYNVRQAIREHIIKRVPAKTKGWRISKEELDRYAAELNKIAFKRHDEVAARILGHRRPTPRQIRIKRANALLRHKRSR